MASKPNIMQNTEASILARLIHPERDDLPKEAALAFLRMDFDQGDLDRIHELVTGNQADALTLDEQVELEGYLRISSLLDLMHAKAHRVVHNQG